MAALEIEYVLKLTHFEGQALKHLLGNMNDKEFAEKGIEGEDRQRLSQIWDLIPYPDEDR